MFSCLLVVQINVNMHLWQYYKINKLFSYISKLMNSSYVYYIDLLLKVHEKGI